MKQINQTLFKVLLFIIISTNSVNLFAQNNCTCASCGVKCGSTHLSSCDYMKGTSSTTKKSSSVITSSDINTMIVGAVFQSLLTSIFSTSSGPTPQEIAAQQQAAALAAQQAAEQQRIAEALAQAKYDKMMGSYKSLGDSQNIGTKTLSNTDMSFKSLDGDAEKMAADARKPFDTAGDLNIPDQSQIGDATPFFGDTMPIENLETLTNIDNNPNVVDLRDAKKYIAEQIKKDSLNIVMSLKQLEPKGNGEPILEKQNCKDLGKKLQGYVNQRNQFQKTINLADSELSTWETANNNAMMNAAKDGLEYFTGNLLSSLADKGKAADRLQQIFNKNLKKMTSEGINVSEIQAKIDFLRKVSSAGQISELVSNVNDWQSFMKNGVSSLIAQLSSSNSEINAMMEEPQMQQYFETEKPELKALLDISKIAASSEVFGKWAAKKMPMVGLIDISIKQIYNGLDWFLSYQRIAESKKIKGGVMDAANYIQRNIEDTYAALNGCATQ